MSDTPTDVATVLQELDQATVLVDELRSSIASGASVDLAAFNAKIETACRSAMALPRDQMPNVRDPLDQLLERLNGAKDDIETARAALADEAEAAG